MWNFSTWGVVSVLKMFQTLEHLGFGIFGLGMLNLYLKIKWHILNNPWVKEEIKREIRKYFQLNENETTAYQNLWM